MESRWPEGWRPRVDFLYSVLHWVKSAFKRKALDQVGEAEARNKEAWRLYRDQTQLFTKLASQSALLSITDSALFGPNAKRGELVKFRKLKEGEEEALRNEVEAVATGRVVVKV